MLEPNSDNRQGSLGGIDDDERRFAALRLQLARTLCDIVVLPATRISANERSLAGDVLLQVLQGVDEAARIDVATRIARVPESPPPLMRFFLLDAPAVAETLLKRNAPLPAALLIECARRGGPAHRLAVASRTDLTAEIVDALIEFDERDVIRAALRRDDYHLSPHAVDALVARSATDRDLQIALMRRPELEPAHGFLMFWWMDGERRKRILTRFALNRAVLQDGIVDLYPKLRGTRRPDPLVRGVLTMLDPRHRPRGVGGESVGHDVVLRTLAAARENAGEEIVEAVSLVAGVSRELASRALRDPGGEPFAVIAKSLGAPRDEFYRMLTEPLSANAMSPAEAEALLDVFDSMSRDYARAILRYWDWKSNPRVANIVSIIAARDEALMGAIDESEGV